MNDKGWPNDRYRQHANFLCYIPQRRQNHFELIKSLLPTRQELSSIMWAVLGPYSALGEDTLRYDLI